MHSRERWAGQLEIVLRRIGIAEGHNVLDCCCGSGTYAVPAAALVGNGGLVYAIDEDRRKLQQLKQEASFRKLRNIRIIEQDVESGIPLRDSAVDFVLLYDLFWYFRPAEDKTERLLTEVRRVARATAVISVYPTHVDAESLGRFDSAMQKCGFVRLNECSEQLVHDGELVAGTLVNYVKK